MPQRYGFSQEQEEYILFLIHQAVWTDRHGPSSLERPTTTHPMSPRWRPETPRVSLTNWSSPSSPATTLGSRSGVTWADQTHDQRSQARHSLVIEAIPSNSSESFVTARTSHRSLHYTAESPRSSDTCVDIPDNPFWTSIETLQTLLESRLRLSRALEDLTDFGLLKREKQEPEKDHNLVSWDDASDPTNPKNWPIPQKWTATILVSIFSFLSPFASSMIAPAMDQMSQDLNISSGIEMQICFSIYILGFAFGPLFLAPLSEIYGRFWVLQLSMILYLVFSLGSGFAKTALQMIVFRFLSGLGGSAPLVIGNGVISDCWLPEQRGKAIAIYALAPLLGPALGPIYAGFVVSATTWRWLFWSTSIADALIQITGYFCLKESYAPRILQRKAAALRLSTGNQDLYAEADRKTITSALRTALVRPFRLLCTQPIVQVISLYMAYVFGLFYLILSTFPRVWEGTYGESVEIGGLNYLSLSIGYLIGAQISSHCNDRIYRRLKHSNNGVGKSEFRIPLMFIASILMPIGLFWYGWSAHARVHWIVPNLGIGVFAVGSVVALQVMQTYIIDSYTRFAASGMAAAVVLRSIAGFAFPLFADYMYDSLGLGWGGSVLGFAGVVIGIPAPFLFWFWGERLRARSKYAAG